MDLQEQQIKEQNALNTANTNLQNKLNQNPLVNYVPTRRRGGKLPKYQTENTIDPGLGRYHHKLWWATT